MKTKIYSLLTCAGLMLAMGSCSDNPDYLLGENGGATGQVDLTDLGAEVDSDEITISRADGVDPSTFIVKIVNADGQAVYESTYADCHEIITLPVADGYAVRVYSHEVEAAAWASPYYYGETSFDVKANDITEIGTVNCKFANIRVTVNYTDELKAIMSEGTVTVKCSETGSQLDFAHNELRSGYFRALEGSTTLAAEFTGVIAGQEAHLTRALDDVKAGQHRIITFSVRRGNNDVPGEYGTAEVKLSDGLWLTTSVTEESVDGNVDSAETGDGNAERPGKEDPVVDPNEPDDPVVEPTTPAITIEPDDASKAGGLDLDKVNPATLPHYVINIHADKGIDHLNVTITSTDAGFIATASEVVPLDFDLATVSGEDEGKLHDDLKLPTGSEVLNQTDVPFNVSELVPLLMAFPNATHTFTIVVTDKVGNKLEKKLIINS